MPAGFCSSIDLCFGCEALAGAGVGGRRCAGGWMGRGAGGGSVARGRLCGGRGLAASFGPLFLISLSPPRALRRLRRRDSVASTLALACASSLQLAPAERCAVLFFDSRPNLQLTAETY